MKKIIITLLLFVVATPFFAQKLGLQAGYTLTNTSVGIDYSQSKIGFATKPASGFTVGPIFSWDFMKNLGADIAIMANMRSADFKISYKDQVPTVFKQTLYYLDIPLHAYFKYEIKDVALTIFAGPSFNIGLDGSNYAYYDNEMQKPKFNSAIDQTQLFGKEDDSNLSPTSYKRFEIGIDLGIGVEYKNILFKASWMQGMNNITQNKSYPYGLEDIGAGIKHTYRQGVFSFCVGYVFDLKRDKTKTYSK